MKELSTLGIVHLGVIYYFDGRIFNCFLMPVGLVEIDDKSSIVRRVGLDCHAQPIPRN